MKLCIVIPSFNQADFLEASVRSVVEQTTALPGAEVRLMDGGSGLEVLEIIERLKRDYPQLEVQSRPDDGQADALARGFAATDADIIGWLNSDDLLLPGALNKVLSGFGRWPESHVIYGDALFIDERGVCTGAYPTAPFDPELLKSFCYLSQPSVFFRRSAYLGAGGIDAELRYAIDYDLWLRLLANGARFRYLPEILSATRLHDQSKTATGQTAFTREVRACQTRHFPGSANAGRALWESYRRLIIKAPWLWRPIALLLAWLGRLARPKEIPENAAWAYRVSQLHRRARKRAKPHLGKTFPGQNGNPTDGYSIVQNEVALMRKKDI